MPGMEGTECLELRSANGSVAMPTQQHGDATYVIRWRDTMIFNKLKELRL